MNFKNGFIEKEELLNETSRCNDLLDLSKNIHKFSMRLDKLSWNSIFWLIWNFWEWKSTLINNVKVSRNNKNELWIEFDAWKYPNRENLWEWFVLDFARQVDNKSFITARKSIDWEVNYDKETLMKTLWWAVWTFIPWWGIIWNLSHFFRTSPAKRVFEIQEILTELIENIKQEKIFLVIEDIDRSWDSWIFFLETLKQFISENNFNKNITAIVPIGTKEYENNINSYLKPIDLFDFFNIENPGLENFIKNIFIKDIVENTKLFLPLKEFLEWLFSNYPSEINLRKLKIILRKANHNHKIMFWKYDDKFELDWRLNIIFEASKYINYDKNDSLFKIYKKDNIVAKENSIFTAYINNLYSFVNSKYIHYYWFSNNTSIYDETDSEKLKLPIKTIKFHNEITEKWIVWFWFENFWNLKHYTIPKEYLMY